MPALAESQLSLRDTVTGTDITTFSVDPTSYDPFANAQRGSSHKVLSGSVIHQFFGLRQADFILRLETQVTDYSTMQALWAKYTSKGTIWELRDYFPNRYLVVFAPGEQAFHPVPIIGSCDAFIVTMVFKVLQVTMWFGAAGGYPGP
jgi:hypothetical protein